MKKIQITLFALLFLSICFPKQSYATIFTAISNNDWDSVTTWNQNQIPSLLDTVIIDGYTVTITKNTGDVTIKHLILSDLSPGGVSGLIIDGESAAVPPTVTITGNLNATLGTANNEMKIKIINDAIFQVDGNVHFVRTNSNNSSYGLYLEIDQESKMYVVGNFVYDYQNATMFELKVEIKLLDDALLDIGGNMAVTVQGGQSFNFMADGSSEFILRGNLTASLSGGNNMDFIVGGNAHFQVFNNTLLTNSGGSGWAMLLASGTDGMFTFGGNLTLTSSSVGKEVLMKAYQTNSVINANSNITLIAEGESDVYIDLENGSNLFIRGDFYRPNNYGSLLMSPDATLTYNGSTPQNIAKKKMNNSGTDAFNYTNIDVTNLSGTVLSDTLFVEKNLNLTRGKIITTQANPLIIGDQATLTGGSDSSYIVGPVIKRGRSNGNSFVFPIGDANTYAPIEISEISNASSEFAASYYSDPPPWGNTFESGAGAIDNIIGNHYWELSKKTGSDNVNVMIHWNENITTGMTNMNDVVVARLDETSGLEVWENYGRTATTGTTTAGSVTSSLVMSDPPPWGNTKFTLGSTSALNVLPVELINFKAVPQNKQAYLKWATASEKNTKGFIIERSTNGVTFERIGFVSSNGNSTTTQVYSFIDKQPSKGLTYYRLKMVDIDNSFNYSQIEVVNFDTQLEFNIFPNPVSKTLTINAGFTDTENVILELYDKTGRRLYSETLSFENGKLQIDTSQLGIRSTGIYFIHLIGKSKSQVLKFIKVD